MASNTPVYNYSKQNVTQKLYSQALQQQDFALKTYGYNSPQYKAATNKLQSLVNIQGRDAHADAVNTLGMYFNHAGKKELDKKKARENEAAVKGVFDKVQNGINYIKDNAKDIPVSFYYGINQRLFNNGTSPESEGLREQARLQENYAAQRNADAAQNRQIVNRDERQEAAKDAIAKSASVNEQKVANMGASAGIGAAQLARETVTPNVEQLRQRQDTQRREAVQNEDEMYRLYEDAIMRRSLADASDVYDNNMKDVSNEGQSLAKGEMNTEAKHIAKDIQAYINDIMAGKSKIEEVPSEVKEKVEKAVDVQKSVLSIIDLQNYINAQKEKNTNDYTYVRYKLDNGQVSWFKPDDNYRQSEAMSLAAIKTWFDSNYPGQEMNTVRKELFKEVTGQPITNNSDKTAESLQQCINAAKE